MAVVATVVGATTAAARIAVIITAVTTTAGITIAAARAAAPRTTKTMSELARPLSPGRKVFFAVIVAVLTLMSGVTGVAQDSSKMDSFAQCLAKQKVTMYGSFLCPHCDDQKKLFGASFKYVPYVECSMPGIRQMTFACRMAEIRFTPTWIFPDGERQTGLQSLQQLSTKTGCRLP